MWGSLLKKGRGVTKRFLFDAAAITALKSQASGGSSARVPSKVKVASAFIWKSAMAASKAKHEFQRPSLLTHYVNLRKIISAPEKSIGNLLWVAAAKQEPNSNSDLHHLVRKLREVMSKIDGDFVKKLGSEEGNSAVSESLRNMKELGSSNGVDWFCFSSRCNFNFCEPDFGWGEAVWFSSMSQKTSVFLNLITFVDTKSGDGIEAWVMLDKEEMAILEGDAETAMSSGLHP